MDAVRTDSSRALLAAIVEQTSEAIAVIGDDARITFTNDAALRLLGGAPGDYVGVSVVDILHPDEVDRVATVLSAVSGGDQPLPGLIRLRRGDGEWRAYEIRPSPVRFDGGEVTMVMFRDTSLQEVHWNFLTDLSAGVEFVEAVDRFARGMANDVDGPMAISFGDDTDRTVVGGLPAAMAGVGPDGHLDVSPGGPWAAALGATDGVVVPLAGLPAATAAAAASVGAASCVALAVADPGSRSPMLVTQWPPRAAHAEVLARALERRPHHALTLALERREAMRRLETLAHHDELTGLVNRQRFYELTETLVASGSGCGVCYIDLDRFKPVNDQFGHEAGDAVIEACGRRLRALCRPGDVAGRLGGDEFALAAAGIDATELAALAARVVAALGSPYAVAGAAVDVGASAGTALARPGQSAADVIAAADAALYAAKRAGRGTWRHAE